MVQDVSVDLVKWLRSSLDEFTEETKSEILNDLSKIISKKAPNEEKKIFKYIAKYVMGHINPPKIIEGKPAFQGVSWPSLAESTIKRKRNNKKWIDTGSLKMYLRALSATYWYGKPKTIVSTDKDLIMYYSMFNYQRKPFRAHDEKGVSQEYKITGDGLWGEDGDNLIRPIFSPMEDFMFEKAENLIYDLVNEYMEENYGTTFDVSSTY